MEILKIGEFYEQHGGIFAGIMPGENGNADYQLFVAPEGPGKTTDIEWGGYGNKAAGPNSEFDGAANTRALAESEQLHPAAEWASNLTIGEHSDYYLPAKREALLMAATLGVTLGTELHWSSTQFSAYDAWSQDFEGGLHCIDCKDSRLAVRAVRRDYLLTH